ncbi:PEP-CTERM sorting domain-containing protein [Cellvibrio sp. NN19]|uniref:PEP-CTERM sorting domain-containing protein n=1 Tax=Cellvibrio chitinivorans TaxID=3102792 RepID=UPI002B417B6C|nr:PEP-CTERM sorting domain-containing protein [Cellvibrio sp. NN19]
MYKLPRNAVGYLAAALFAFLALPCSAAYLKFTYANPDLFFSSHKVNGVPTEIEDGMGFVPLIPAFALSFTLPEKDLSLQPTTSFFTRELNLSLSSDSAGYLDFPIDLSPSSYAQVLLDQTGQIASWNLVAFARELITPETNLEAHRLTDRWVNVRSYSTSGDQLVERFHPLTSRRETLIQLALLEFNYADETSLSNWTIERIDVPEPGLAGLFFSGLATLLWCRRRDRSPTR